MIGLRQIRWAGLGKGRPHPYLAVVTVYTALLLLSRLWKVELRPREQDPAPSLGKREAREDPGPPVAGAALHLLTNAFKAADFDGNKLLSSPEMAMAISRQTKQHIMHAMRNNFKVFFSLDRGKKNGQVDWDEYYGHYLADSLGLDQDTIRSLKTRPSSVARSVQESVSRLKAAWWEAARSNPNMVNIDEFLSLEHPESSMSLLMQRVEEMLTNHDGDGDGKISREEYHSHRFRNILPEEEAARRKEFDTVLDKDKNGLAERKELIQFLDPKHQHWAREEAAMLLRDADYNSDGNIDMEEMASHSTLFLSSKLVSPERSFHGEF